VAAVLFLLVLLGCTVILYLAMPGFSTSASSPTTQSATPGAVSPSAGPSRASEPSPPSATTTPGAGDKTGSGSAEEKPIQVADPAVSAKPFQTVRIQGRYRGGAETLLQVQRWEAGQWAAFPLPTKTDQSGQFTAYVELGQPGRYQLRVLDPDSGVTSKPFVLVIER
jgi:hypothetical protein